MPSGALRTATLGNGVSETWSYNNRLQASLISSASATQTWFSRTYDYGTTNNNGNVLHIYDNLSGNRSQTFGYDQLNRIASAATSATSGPDAWSQTFNIDPWGNLNQSGSYNFVQPFTANNRMSGYSYDTAGDLLNDTFHSYAYDGESRITTVDGTGPTYTYGADGQRSRKDAGGDYTEYVYFGGQAIAETNSVGDWSDYVFAGGQRVVKAEGLNRDLHIYGTTAGSSQYSLFYFPGAAGLNGYTIRSGDRLYLTQFQDAGSKGGLILIFSDGSSSGWNVKDQDGYWLNDDQAQNATHVRSVDLSGLAGKIITQVVVNNESDTTAGNWNIYFDNIALVAVDGTVTPIYTGQTSSPISSFTGTSGESGLGSTIDTNGGKATHPSDTTTYYTADHLGSSRLLTSGTGYAIWSGTFLPFGHEWNPQITMNHQKFTGKERDTESGNDYFGARYYASSMGRFVSPDPSGLLAQKPQNPQSWNLYTYALNNPIINLDPSGLDCVYANDAGNGVESIDHASNSGECGSNGGTWAPGYVDENWAHFNNNTDMFQVGSVDGAGSGATVDYTNFAAGAQTDADGNCTSGCGGYGFSSASADWLQGQLRGNSMSGGLDGYIQFLTGREESLAGGFLNQLISGPLDPSKDRWAGPGGFGPPGGTGDWAGSMHDYNFSQNGPAPGQGITIGMYFNPTLSAATSRALIQSNNTLIRNAGGIQSVKMGLFFGVVNAFQWLSHAF
jgi:RHS repeat-associated protein